MNIGNNNRTDIFILKFSNNGTRLWATYYGGTYDENMLMFSNLTDQFFNDVLRADGCGNIYLGFNTYSSNNTLMNAGCNSYYDNNLSLSEDCFLLKFSKRNELKWATYAGGQNGEVGLSLALDKNNNVFACGTLAGAFGFPVKQYGNLSYYINTNAGIYDAFLWEFEQPKLSAGVSYSHCNPGCTGSASVSVTSNCSTGAYSYLWSTGSTVSSINGLCNGPYSVIVRDTLFGCSADTVNFTLSNGFQFTPAVSPYACSNTCDGYASINIPGISNATYVWDTFPNNTSSINALCSGNHFVIVTVPGCGADTVNYYIPVPPVLTITINSVINPGSSPCPNACNGYAQVVLSGGEAPGYCFWSNGDVGNFADSLCHQTYTITATDSMCYSTTIPLILPPPAAFSINATGSLACGCNGFASVSLANAGIAPTILWNTGQTTSSISNLCPGMYTVAVTSSCGGGTLYDTCYVVTANPLNITSFNVSVHPCAGMCNGVASVIFNGGTGPYIITWSNGQTGNPATNLCDDSTYYVTITDACGGSDNDSITIHALSSSTFAVNANVITYTCPGSCNGVAMATGGGGLSPFSFTWSNGQIGATAINLCPDSTYLIIGTDGCGSIDSFYYTFPHASHVQVNMGHTASCAASCQGTAYAYVVGGVQPFTYVWNTGATGSSIIYGCCAGSTYTVIVTDACGTSDTNSTIIPLEQPMTAWPTIVNASCSWFCNGSATVNFVGGSPPFMFFWSNNTFNQTAIGLCPDSSYYVIVSDPGCVTDTFYITMPIAVPVNAYATSIINNCSVISCNGSACVSQSGGVGPYSYHWNSGQNSACVSNLCAGNYFCVVTDVCGTFDTVFITITNIPPVDASINNIIQNDCFFNCTAHATAFGVNGTPPFQYHWSNGQNSQVGYNLCAGTYWVCVTDPNCATDTAWVTITTPTAMVALIDTPVTPLICQYDCDGIAHVHTFGAVPPFTYLWSNGVTDSTNSSLCTGNNFVTITDPGCSSQTINFFVNSISHLNADITVNIPATCFDTCNGVALAVQTGGIPPFTFLWNTGQTIPDPNDFCDGLHSVIITDSLGCVASDSIITLEPTPVIPSFQIIQSHCENPDGTIIVSASGGYSPYTYLWYNNSTNDTITGLVPGNYAVTVTDSNQCNATLITSLTGHYPTLHISNDTTILLGNSTDIFVSGADTFLWSFNPALNCINCFNPHVFNLETSTYCVVGTDAWGCMDTACVTVTIDDNCGDVFLPNAFSPNGDGSNDKFHVLAWCLNTYHIQIFNRWGQLVYESEDYTTGWDGTYEGNNAEVGVYVYHVVATNLRSHKFEKNGNVTLIR